MISCWSRSWVGFILLALMLEPQSVLSQLQAPKIVEKHAPPYWIKVPTVTPVPLITFGPNQTAVVECVAGGNPAPSISWLKNDDAQDFSAVSSQLNVTGNKLVLHRLMGTYALSGWYTCVAANPYGKIYHDFAVRGLAPPVIVVQPSSFIINTKLDADVKLLCGARGIPRPIISWKLGSMQLTNSTTGVTVQTLASGISKLIVSVKASFLGMRRDVFSCVASNSLSRNATASATIQYTSYSGENELEDVSDVEVLQGQTAKLRCLYQGLSLTTDLTMEWQVSNSLITPMSYPRINTTLSKTFHSIPIAPLIVGTLEIQNASISDSRTYVCVSRVTDGSYKDYYAATISVKALPTAILRSGLKSPVYVSAGRAFILNGYPQSVRLADSSAEWTILRSSRLNPLSSTQFNAQIVSLYEAGLSSQIAKPPSSSLRLDSDRIENYRCTFDGVSTTVSVHTLRKCLNNYVVDGEFGLDPLYPWQEFGQGALTESTSDTTGIKGNKYLQIVQWFPTTTKSGVVQDVYVQPTSSLSDLTIRARVRRSRFTTAVALPPLPRVEATVYNMNGTVVSFHLISGSPPVGTDGTQWYWLQGQSSSRGQFARVKLELTTAGIMQPDQMVQFDDVSVCADASMDSASSAITPIAALPTSINHMPNFTGTNSSDCFNIRCPFVKAFNVTPTWLPVTGSELPVHLQTEVDSEYVLTLCNMTKSQFSVQCKLGTSSAVISIRSGLPGTTTVPGPSPTTTVPGPSPTTAIDTSGTATMGSFGTTAMGLSGTTAVGTVTSTNTMSAASMFSSHYAAIATTAPAQEDEPDGHGRLSAAVIGGIVAAAALVTFITTTILCVAIWRKRQKRRMPQNQRSGFLMENQQDWNRHSTSSLKQGQKISNTEPGGVFNKAYNDDGDERGKPTNHYELEPERPKPAVVRVNPIFTADASYEALDGTQQEAERLMSEGSCMNPDGTLPQPGENLYLDLENARNNDVASPVGLQEDDPEKQCATATHIVPQADNIYMVEDDDNEDGPDDQFGANADSATGAEAADAYVGSEQIYEVEDGADPTSNLYVIDDEDVKSVETISEQRTQVSTTRAPQKRETPGMKTTMRTSSVDLQPMDLQFLRQVESVQQQQKAKRVEVGPEKMKEFAARPLPSQPHAVQSRRLPTLPRTAGNPQSAWFSNAKSKLRSKGESFG